ncbi:MAG TPA: hypothetical protein VK517_14730, partial [Cyclobacteriaceae bacterium]|nr:hypothetical protein [Cyclobacteriaceae bacterium]
MKKLDTFKKRLFHMELVAEKVDYTRLQSTFQKQKERSLLLRREPVHMRKKRLGNLSDWIFANRDRIKHA